MEQWAEKQRMRSKSNARERKGEAMYNLKTLIEDGSEIMESCTNSDFPTLSDFIKVKNEMSGSDAYMFANNMFLIGVSLGARIQKSENGRPQH